ncbi:MAG: hypothetical protein JWQ75_1704 [Pseudarthrobacter sp.]|nr:hypothetical protein [Pseudarthrobacter sp.]
MIKPHVQDLASMGRPVRLSTLIATGLARIRTGMGTKSPYRVGDAVVADDPFNGRLEGIVVSRHGYAVGVGTAAGTYVYDHRQLRRQD